MPAGTYVPQDYWERVLSEGFDESGVAYPTLAVSLNRALYDAMRREVGRTLAAAGVDVRGARVLDVGSGIGVWIDYWRARGAAHVAAVDLTEVAVRRLRERFPDTAVEQADVGDPATRLPEGNDLVSAMSVLLHITDEERFRQAIANLGASLAPGGALVLMDPALVRPWRGRPFDSSSNSRARPLAAYRAACAAAGLELELVRPATCLLANPIDARTARAYRAKLAAWNLLCLVVGRRERVGAALGRGLLALDGPACRIVAHGPGSKILLARKRS